MFGKAKERKNHNSHSINEPQTLAEADFSSLLNSLKFGRDAKTAAAAAHGKTGEGTAKTYEPASGELMEEAFKLMKAGDFDQASEQLHKALFLDLENKSCSAALKCADYWAEKKRRLNFTPEEKQAEFIFDVWQAFQNDALSRLEDEAGRAVYSIKHWAFGKCASLLENAIEADGGDSRQFMLLGRACKFRGAYDLALEAYMEAVALDKRAPQILAETADCFALADQEKQAQLFFREAFFHGPGQIDLAQLESAMIKNLEAKTRKLLANPVYTREWMAVYGVLWDVFSIARELRPAEYAKLNQNIQVLRAELDERPDKREELAPRLIYMLFWFIDYHKSLSTDMQMTRDNIKSAFLEIRFLDERIFKQYKI